MNRFTFIALTAIIVGASILRLSQLGSVPASPDWDEVALGYNAYSIALTGRDEYGTRLPVVLRSFDDYKPALYAYLIIPTYKIFGLNTFSVRLPSALFGILTVMATYFLVKELFKPRNTKSYTEYVPLLAAFLLAISPWHIQFSRIAFESNVGLALNLFGIVLFLYGLKRYPLLIASAASLGLALYAYQSEKVFTPILGILLFCVFFKDLLRVSRLYLVLSILVGLSIASPILHYTLTNQEALARAKGVSVFSAPNQYLDDYAIRNIVNKEKGDFIGFIFDNRRVAYLKFITSNYLSHYNLYWLFLQGDEARHHAPQMGLLYLWELPFLFMGIYVLVFMKIDRKIKFLLFGWFFIAPIPAAFTTGVPHAVRTLNFLPTFQIFAAIGVLSVLLHIKNLKFSYLKFPIIIFIFSFFIFNFLYYLNQYFVQQNRFNSKAWQYGYEELMVYVKEVEQKYNRIIVSNKPHLDQSYMFFLFYLQYPPAKYQEETENASGGFAELHQFGKYEFRPIVWDSEKKDGKTLFIGKPDDFRYKAAKVIKTIYFLDGDEAIKIAEG